MAYVKSSKSAAVRARLDHPVIDGDGHWLEPIPVFLDYLRDVAGPTVVDRFVKKASETTWYDLAPEDRMSQRIFRPTWWGEPASTLDRATAMVPRLFYERLDDFGLDFCVLYTSLGLFYVSNPDEEIRRAVSRAVNRMNADMFRPYAHRITPAAVVPVHTPQEAIEEATYAVRELGLKVLMIANHVRRPVPAFARAGAEPREMRLYMDSLGFESAHDYDPFWARCADLKVAVTAHSGSMGTHWRESVWSFTYNHIGHFANASHAFAKALILGGVTHRFPQLRFAFLEGGVGWACNLLTDLVGHWERRRRDAMESQTRPTNLDRQLLKDLFREYGGRLYEEKPTRSSAASAWPSPSRRRRSWPSAPTSRSSTTSARCPCARPKSCAATSASASTSAARPTTPSRRGPSTGTAATDCAPSSRRTWGTSTWWT
jgi:predicted TIM-barrel fold metal-dependent hydrolase